MISSLLDLKNKPGGDLGGRMLNTVASQSIRHLFTSSELVDVDIRCEPSSKLLQGSIDSFKMKGRELVIRRAFAVKEMMFETDAVMIDTAALLAGKLQLKQPTQAVAQVVLTEEAINKAFEADLVKQRLQGVDAEPLTNLSGGDPVSFRNVQVELKPDNQVRILAFTDLPNRNDVPIALTSKLAVERRRRVVFKDAKFDDADIADDVKGLATVLSNGFAEILNSMVDLDRFDLDGVKLRINRLETHGKTLVFSGYAQIDHVPNA
ncbi:MAG: DUF2993 domain-containing protein [Cyanothece sp. SIO2G6]|nr:DUF2993 domain-containing protein [Cyanothece sp. SIO2G6]